MTTTPSTTDWDYIQTQRNLRNSDIIPPDRMADVQATVVGIGSIGRQVALQLATCGVPNIALYDHDTVEAVNLGPQGYRPDQIGTFKSTATAFDIRRINKDCDVLSIPSKFTADYISGTHIFICVDTIGARSFFWHFTPPENSSRNKIEGRKFEAW